MNEDIIATVPHACGDKDCSVGWHLEHYWIYSDGTYSVCDADGNHDDCDADDAPSPDEVSRRWLDYSRHVAETGADPLAEFTVKRTVTRKESWRFDFGPSILGTVVNRAKRGRKTVDPRYLPEHVREYLTITKASHSSMESFPTWASFCETFPDYKPGRWFSASIECKTERSAETVTRELRRAARAHIAKHTKLWR
jgi:hypothetical protein